MEAKVKETNGYVKYGRQRPRERKLEPRSKVSTRTVAGALDNLYFT
jgi:hypothetical protein